MKIKSGQVVPNADIKKMYYALDSTRGTNNYTEYYMEVYWYDEKHKAWKFLGHGVPRTNLDGRIKIYKDTIWIVIEADRNKEGFGHDKQRFRVTSNILELMDWEI